MAKRYFIFSIVFLFHKLKNWLINVGAKGNIIHARREKQNKKVKKKFEVL